MTSTIDDNAPATKRDLKNLQQTIDGRFKDVDVQFQTVMKYVRAEAEETRRHFDVVAEDIKHDFKGAFHDKLEQHEDRIIRLEQHAGFVS